MNHQKSCRKIRNSLICVFLCITLIALSGCGRKNKTPPPPITPPPPTTIDALLTAAEDVNPDINARPSPIVVRVYQLKSAGLFDLTDFDALYHQDTTILADDLVSRDEFHMKPGDKLEYKRKPASDARFLAVMGAYRNLNNAVWKKVFEIPSNQISTINIQLNALSIDIINQTYPQ